MRKHRRKDSIQLLADPFTISSSSSGRATAEGPEVEEEDGVAQGHLILYGMVWVGGVRVCRR